MARCGNANPLRSKSSSPYGTVNRGSTGGAGGPPPAVPWMKRTALLAVAALLGLVAAAPAPLVLARDASFFVGGSYVKTPRGTVMDGQMYVHALVPAKQTHRYPIVMIHGQSLTGANYETTADGRE